MNQRCTGEFVLPMALAAHAAEPNFDVQQPIIVVQRVIPYKDPADNMDIDAGP